MTGIERLRAFARRMDELGVWPGGAKLLAQRETWRWLADAEGRM